MLMTGPRPPVPGRGRSGPLLVTSIAAGLLLVIGAVLTYLWLAAESELSDTRTDLNGQIEELNTTVSGQSGEIDRLGDELETAQDELTDAQTALEGTENQVEVLEDEQDVIGTCIRLVREANVAIEDGDDEAAEELLIQAGPVCDEADRILGLN
jgi:prefoldin subunit 5